MCLFFTIITIAYKKWMYKIYILALLKDNKTYTINDSVNVLADLKHVFLQNTSFYKTGINNKKESYKLSLVEIFLKIWSQLVPS